MSWVGPKLIRDSMSQTRMFPQGAREEDQFPWQYHSRSDHHSKIAALGVVIDLIQESPKLRSAIESGRVGYKLNPKMRDRTNREKSLDLSLGIVDDTSKLKSLSTMEQLLAAAGGIVSDKELDVVLGLPEIREAPIKHDLIVLENKACMTAHAKAAPRLRNELEGAVDAINNSDPYTVAGGLVVVNASDTFVSPTYRDNGHQPPTSRLISSHSQPSAARDVIAKLRNIPLRGLHHDQGYDALGIVVVDAQNDGTPWTLVVDPAFGAPQKDDIWSYGRMIQQLAKVLAQRWRD